MIVIDYRQLLEKIDNPPYTLYSAGDRAAWLDECIATAHAFDAEPVKHGRWISQGDDMWLCSNCKENIIYSMHKSDRTEKQRYCCRCGARMDIKEGDSDD